MSSKASKQFKKMSGCLQLKVNHKWTEYDFATCGVFFHYFNKAKVYDRMTQDMCDMHLYCNSRLKANLKVSCSRRS